VQVRIGYNAGQRQNDPVPPPSGSSAAFLDPLNLSVCSIRGHGALMHHKYIVRDAATDRAAVWTGTTNWTVDSWTREENVILQLFSRELADFFHRDFEELWESGDVENTGRRDGGSVEITHAGQPIPARVWFSPGQGVDMAQAVAHAMTSARHRILVASPVLTVGTILGALADVIHVGRVAVQGVYDLTQMEEVRRQWAAEPEAAWKIAAFDGIARAARFAGKRSTPYAPGSVHDYMHLKMIVVDDAVFTGSYNFSHSGEENAENLLRLDSSAFAGRCADAIHALVQRYGAGAG
jgi:phosphatidylserine/phosphatidylglycerophosphate/cardiolipin synthase-like enzyme